MNELANAAKSAGTRMNVLGVILVVLGFLAILSPLATGLSIALLVGILVVGGGIVRMMWAFKAEGLGRGILMFALGGLTLICGLALVANPLLGSAVLTLILTAYLVVDGAFEIAGALQVRPADGWGWMLAGGIASVILGILIWRQFPFSGAWAIGILLGIKLLLAGMMVLTVGSAVRRVAKAAA